MIELKLSSKDEVTISEYPRHVGGGNWVDVRVWDDYECRGASLALYTKKDIRSLIEALEEAEKGVEFDE
ncbi:hypothetical protein vBPpSSYP_187 [Pseudomonas phage vB_PpS_SYP]|nr:hypothetical protein vBPpSSYP_187 [Pseudomonas phage vB_PpS_SYP]